MGALLERQTRWQNGDEPPGGGTTVARTWTLSGGASPVYGTGVGSPRGASPTGHISLQTEQAGNRPVRKVYTLTASGRQLLNDLLRENLRTPDAGSGAGDIGLMFLDYLPRSEAIALLRERLARLDAELAAAPAVPPHGSHLSVHLALEHRTVLRPLSILGPDIRT